MAEIRTLKNSLNTPIYPQTLTSAVFNSENKNLEYLLALKANQSTTYSKEEVDNMFTAISTLDIKVVTSLPTTEISTTSIYLLKIEGDINNNYEEYLYVNGVWELIGTTKVDLSDYYTKTEVNNTFATLEKLDNRIYIVTQPMIEGTEGVDYFYSFRSKFKDNTILIDVATNDHVPYVLCDDIRSTDYNALIFSKVTADGNIKYLKYYTDGTTAEVERTTRTTMEQGAVTAFWTGTQAEYDALTTKESTKLYLIKG